MKKKLDAFNVGMAVCGIALVGIIIFIILFAFIPRPGLAPSSDTAEESPMAAAIVMDAQTYVGILPCDDCEGIRTELLLRDDGTFRLAETRLGLAVVRPVIEVGKWTTLRGNAQDLDAVIYRLNHDKLTTARNYLLLPDGNVRYVDEQQEAFGNGSDYTLVKQ